MIEGRWYVILSLMGDDLAKTPISSFSEVGLLNAVTQCVEEADIAHQTPVAILSDLARKLAGQMKHLTPITKTNVENDEITFKKIESTITALQTQFNSFTILLEENINRLQTQLESFNKSLNQLNTRVAILEAENSSLDRI